MTTSNELQALFTDNECIAHAHGFDPDCDACCRYQEVLSAKYKEMGDANNRKTGEIGQLGYGVNHMEIMDSRINLILSLLFNGRPTERIKFELSFCLEVEDMLELVHKNAVRARLAANPSQAPLDIRGR